MVSQTLQPEAHCIQMRTVLEGVWATASANIPKTSVLLKCVPTCVNIVGALPNIRYKYQPSFELFLCQSNVGWLANRFAVIQLKHARNMHSPSDPCNYAWTSFISSHACDARCNVTSLVVPDQLKSKSKHPIIMVNL